MQVSSMAAVRSAVAEPIPLDYGPWLTTSPAGRDFVSRLLQVPLLTACVRAQLKHARSHGEAIDRRRLCNFTVHEQHFAII